MPVAARRLLRVPVVAHRLLRVPVPVAARGLQCAKLCVAGSVACGLGTATWVSRRGNTLRGRLVGGRLGHSRQRGRLK